MATTDYSSLPSRILKLREYEFTAKPTMSAKDFGKYSRFSKGDVENDFFEAVSEVIRNTLVPDSRKAWDDLWELDLDVPITFEEVIEFANGLVEGEAGRPTQRRSPSGTTASATAIPSTDGSGSPGQQTDSSTSPRVLG